MHPLVRSNSIFIDVLCSTLWIEPVHSVEFSTFRRLIAKCRHLGMVSPVKLTTSIGDHPTVSRPLATSVTLRTKHVFPRGSPQNRKISTWVNKLERINSNPGEHPNSTTYSRSLHLEPQSDGNIDQSVDEKLDSDGNDLDDATLCFKTIQLGTEFCLMLFAASLLIIAAIVIVAKKVPAFMEAYEKFPKFLFILCVIVAVWSFSRWLWRKAVKRLAKCRTEKPQDSPNDSKEAFVQDDFITDQVYESDRRNPNQGQRETRLDHERRSSPRLNATNEANWRPNNPKPVQDTNL